MTMRPRLRTAVLATHIAVAVGWIGAVVAYIALDVAATTSADVQSLRAAYLSMDSIARQVIVPLAVASVVTGIVISVGTKWGLFRHWWVLISFGLTIFATLVLLVETRTIGALAATAADPTTSPSDLRALGGTLLHSVGGAAVLLVVLALNVYKPRGLTSYGLRKQQEERRALQRGAPGEHLEVRLP
jgi:hypothetical protein